MCCTPEPFSTRESPSFNPKMKSAANQLFTRSLCLISSVEIHQKYKEISSESWPVSVTLPQNKLNNMTFVNLIILNKQLTFRITNKGCVLSKIKCNIQYKICFTCNEVSILGTNANKNCISNGCSLFQLLFLVQWLFSQLHLIVENLFGQTDKEIFTGWQIWNWWKSMPSTL